MKGSKVKGFKARGHKGTPVRIFTPIATIMTIIVLFLLFREPRLRIAVNQGVESVALKKIIATFAGRNSVSIEVIELPYDRLYESEMEAVAQKDPKYDVIMLDDPWMSAIIGADKEGGIAIQRTDEDKKTPPPRLMKLPLMDCGDFFESTLKVGRYPYDENAGVPKDCKGQDLYALPFVANSQLFMYSKETYEEPPTEWSDVQIKEKDYVMRVGPGNQIVTDFVPMAWGTAKSSERSAANGLSFRTKHILFNGSQEAFDFIGILGRKGGRNLSIISQDDFDLAIQLAKTNASAAIIWSAWAMQMAKLPEPQRNASFGKLRFGQVPGGTPVLGAWLLAVPGNSDKSDIAIDFVKFATEKEQIKLAAKNGNPPPLRSVFEELKDPSTSSLQMSGLFSSLFSEMEKSLDAAIPRPRTPHWKEIETAVGACLSLLYEGEIDSKHAMGRSNDAIEKIQKNVPADYSCQAALMPEEPAGP